MDHTKYHAILDAAIAAADQGNPTALAAVVEAGDTLYHSSDWSTWSEQDRVVFGIMIGARLSNPDMTADVFPQHQLSSLCTGVIGDRKSMLEIAKLVWKDLK